MADDKSWPGADKIRNLEAELEDRERMSERALATIRQTGSAAALYKCSELADQINDKLLQLQFKNLIIPLKSSSFRYFWSGPPRSLKNYNPPNLKPRGPYDISVRCFATCVRGLKQRVRATLASLL